MKPMHLFVVSCVFPPEPVVSARTSAQIAAALVARGHQVTVVAPFPNRPSGVLYPGYVRRLYYRQRSSQGFDVIRCFSVLSPRSSMVGRFLENLSFGVTGGWTVLIGRRPDVIYANTWPLFAAGILSLVAWLRHAPLVISVQDIYPDSLVVQGRIRAEGMLARWLRWLDGIVARGARAVIVISERFAAIYRDQRRVAPQRLHVIPNWIDGSSITLDDRSNQFRRQKGIPDESFVVVYGGNIGMAAGVETVIESFRYQRDVGNLRLVIAGEGNNLAACQDLAKRIAPERILFHCPWPIHETSTVLRAADLLVLPTQGSQSIASVPSKLIVYMLTARPVVALALPHSDLAEMVKRSGCGWVIRPDRPELLTAKIKEIMLLGSSELVRRGQAGRKFALRNLTSETCLPLILDVLEKATKQ